MTLLTLLAIVAIAIVRQRSLFGVVILMAIYSFLMANAMIVLDAMDVAMTEASVGAGISTVILLATLNLVKSTEMQTVRRNLQASFVALGTGLFLIWGMLALPAFGTADAPIHKHVAPRYLADSIKETNVPNVVTAILADYRSYDTLGEITVIFTAGIGVMLLLRGGRRKSSSSRLGTSK